MLLSNVTNVSKETLSLMLFLFMLLQVCASQAIFAEGHSVSVCCTFLLISPQFSIFNMLICLFLNSPDFFPSPGSHSFVVR